MTETGERACPRCGGFVCYNCLKCNDCGKFADWYKKDPDSPQNVAKASTIESTGDTNDKFKEGEK